MELDNSLLKEFAQITNDSTVEPQSTYLRGTVVKGSDGKFVQIDGSTTVTPISEIVDVEEGDRVLVSIENHRATIIGNFSFPPSARKEQEALDQAGEAQDTANAANTKAQEAGEKADTAITQSGTANASAAEAKQQAASALSAANTASANASEAKELATKANTDASEAKNQAAASQAASANAQAEVTRLQGEVSAAKKDASDALKQLDEQADEIESVKTTYATKVEVGNTKAELETTITTKVGELETAVSKTYSTKAENVELEGRLQSQITQNADSISSQVSKMETLESDTEQAKKDVSNALAKAGAAQTAATEAQQKATTAQTVATEAQTAANEAQQKATAAQTAATEARTAANAADAAVQAAQSDLNEAKQNLANVTSRVDATEADIAEAQSKVDKAQTDVNSALADAAEANLAATKAQQAADKAQTDAENAQGAANTAQQKADNAQTAATNAQNAADKAQADVAALTKRVTNAETTINQNSENITLNANKTTEIGEKVDSIDTDLTNNYYTKTETDAQIKVQSDRITSTVSKVETVEKNAVISSVEEFYLSTSPTELTGGSWSTSQPTWAEGKYIWRRIYVTKGDGSTSYQPSQNGVCITGNTGPQGPQGNPGDAGNGIASITKYYLVNSGEGYYTWDGDITDKECALSSSSTYVSQGYYKICDIILDPDDLIDKPVVYTVCVGGQYYHQDPTLQSIENLTDDGSVFTAVCDGAALILVVKKTTSEYPYSPGLYFVRASLHDATQIAYVSQLYAKKSATIDTPGWTTDVQFTDANNPYLWTYERIEYTNGETHNSEPIMIGTPGKGIVGSTIDYQWAESGTITPTGVWLASIPENTENYSYLWTRTVITYSDDTTSTAYSVGTTPDGINVGGRNLIILSSAENGYRLDESGGKYECAASTLTDYIPILDSNTLIFTTYAYYGNNDDTYYQVAFYDNNKEFIDQPLTVSPQYVDPNDNWYITIPNYQSHGKSAFYMRAAFPTECSEKVKIEYGNKSTDWSPAPEDINESINNVEANLTARVDEVNTSLETAQSTIDQLSNMISHLVTDENGGSLMTQTANGWTFNMSSINGNLNAIKNAMANMQNDQNESNSALQKLSDLVDSVAQKTAYITMSTIGEEIIEWNGDTTGLGGSVYYGLFYKVSDKIYSPDELLGKTIIKTIAENGVVSSMKELTITAIENVTEGGEVFLGKYPDTYSPQPGVLIVRSATTGYTRPGTYFHTGYNGFTSNLIVNAGDPCIELGKTDNLFKLRITNTAIDFLEGSARIAYANNNTFYSEKIITNELQVGTTDGFVWQKRPNGNLGLTYISG